MSPRYPLLFYLLHKAAAVWVTLLIITHLNTPSFTAYETHRTLTILFPHKIGQ